jgi:dTDP-glucose pyrophosphorylase
MKVLDASGLEIVLVVVDSRLIGVITDGDLRRALLAGMGFEGPVSQVMQEGFTWVPPEMDRADVLDIMKARGFKQIPVLGKSRELLGLHTLDDLLGTKPRKNAALILCGGFGTRLHPITKTIPKPMLPVAGRPILERIVLHLVGCGIRKIYLATHFLGEIIESHFRDGGSFGCSIDYIKETVPMGTGGSLGLLPPEIDSPLLVMNGDLVTHFDAGRMVEHHTESGNIVTVGYSTHIHEVPFGVLDLQEGLVCGWQEKPRLSFPISAGIYVIDPAILSRVNSVGPIPITWVVEDCLRRREPVGIFPVGEDWVDIGRHEELKKARGNH